jgi:hypothetical protein
LVGCSKVPLKREIYKEKIMANQTWKELALSAACAVLMFRATLGAAQLGPHRSNHQQASPKSPTKIHTAPPGGGVYTYSLFDFPGTFYTYPTALNVGAKAPKVEIVGGYGDADLLFPESFLLYGSEKKGGVTETYETVNVPGVAQQGAFGVNDTGQIVGQYLDSSSVYHGWELSGGTFTTIDVPFNGATATIADGINDSDEIAGCWNGSGSAQHGFTLIGTTYTSFDYPGAIQSCAWSLNNNGDIVGYWVDTSNVEHGFLLSGGTYTSIDPPGSFGTIATGINDAAEIVGEYCPTSPACGVDNLQGFLLSKGSYTAFTIPGAVGTGLSAINNKGLLVGGYEDVAGFAHGFVAVP